jgi:hypothetical protein
LGQQHCWQQQRCVRLQRQQHVLHSSAAAPQLGEQAPAAFAECLAAALRAPLPVLLQWQLQCCSLVVAAPRAQQA